MRAADVLESKIEVNRAVPCRERSSCVNIESLAQSIERTLNQRHTSAGDSSPSNRTSQPGGARSESAARLVAEARRAAHRRGGRRLGLRGLLDDGGPRRLLAHAEHLADRGGGDRVAERLVPRLLLLLFGPLAAARAARDRRRRLVGV